MWLAFVLLRAGLGLLWGALFKTSSSDGAILAVHTKCLGTDLHYEVVEVRGGDCDTVSVPLLST